MELTIKLDDKQVQFLLDAFSHEMTRKLRRHVGKYHDGKLIAKKVG